MQFRLLYEGRIAPRQRINVADIHKIRMALHPQLKTLWGLMPPQGLSAEELRAQDCRTRPGPPPLCRSVSLRARRWE
jgi:hypothetical protein